MPRPDPPHTGRARLRMTPGGVGPYPDKPPKRRRRKGGEPEREPVEPHNPKPLAGGAAAALDYDE